MEKTFLSTYVVNDNNSIYVGVKNEMYLLKIPIGESNIRDTILFLERSIRAERIASIYIPFIRYNNESIEFDKLKHPVFLTYLSFIKSAYELYDINYLFLAADSIKDSVKV